MQQKKVTLHNLWTDDKTEIKGQSNRAAVLLYKCNVGYFDFMMMIIIEVDM